MNLLFLGGEPTLRDDLPELIDTFQRYSPIETLSISTNGLLPNRIEHLTKRIFEVYHNPLTFNLSIDGIGETHDRLRGGPGNYKAMVATYHRLVRIMDEFPNLHLVVTTTLSQANLDELEHLHNVLLENFPRIGAHNVALIHSVQEGSVLQPLTSAQLREHMPLLRQILKAYLKGHSKSPLDFVRRLALKMRPLYYDFALQQMEGGNETFTALPGVTQAAIDCYGGLHPYSSDTNDTLAVSLADFDFDFRKAWKSVKFRELVRELKENNCEACACDFLLPFFKPKLYPLLLRSIF